MGTLNEQNMLQKTLLLCALAVAYATATPLLSTGKNIVELAIATPELSTLVTALKAGALVDTLSGEGPFTVFAPTNEAFAKLSAFILAHLLEPANVKELDAVLEYHVVSGAAVFSNYLTDGETIQTVEGQNVTVSIYNGRVFINNALVTTADVAASNGVVHIIDTVLNMPPAPAPPASKNIVELAIATPDFSTLVTALKAGALVDYLSAKGPFTVFAPTNEAFAKLPAATLTHLLDPANVKELDALLEYHVVSGAVFSKDLKTFQMVKTVEGGELKIVKIGSRVLVQNATVTAADNAATNGVVHIIDSVLSPPAPAPSKSIVDLVVADPDLSTLVTALKAAGLVNTLSGPGPFNVFTPSNAAFAALPDGVLANLLKPENKAQLVDLLLYHVSKGSVDYPTDRQLSDNPGFPFPKLIETLAAGKNITVQATNHPCGRGGRNKCYNILLETGNTSPKSPRKGVNIANSNVPNTNAANGVLHPVGRVLTPPAPLPNIVQLAQSVPDLSTLVTALVAGKLTDALSGTGPFTVFAPTNEAFAKIPAATLARLLDPANIKELDTLLEYHVIVGAAIFAKDLKPTQEVKTLEGDELKIVVNAGRVTVNNNTVTAADNAASNGVVHIIDGVLLPPSF